MTLRRLWLLVVLSGCPQVSIPEDGGAQPRDAGAFDAGAGDAGLPPDGGGFEIDAGVDGGTEVPFEWPVPVGPITITPSPHWKLRISGHDDAFAGGDGQRGKWVKFTVLMRDPSRVYFQDSNEYPFHIEFATAHLDPFMGMTRAQFEAVSLHEAGQEAITGAVLFPPMNQVAELGIQLVRRDAYRKEMVKIVFDLVRDSIDDAAADDFYMPTFEQQSAALRDKPWLEAREVKVSGPDRWTNGAHCYAPGWAVGRLVRVAPQDIETAYRDGALTAADVLLTDGVPAELPPLAGIVTTRPATPSSHVAILANTWGIPFVYAPLAQQQALLASLEGKKVVLDLSMSGGAERCQLDVFALDPATSSAVEAELLSLRQPSPLNLTPKQSQGGFSVSVDGLGPADLRFVGGKAANFGVLRAAVPDNAYQAVAFTFDLWDDAMAQPVPGGRTLGEEIASRLQGHQSYPPADLFALKQALAGVRSLIREHASFSPAADAAVRAALQPFDPLRKIRFRSSTNVEDTDDFTGAGLYDSYSGCFADDTDGDTSGPSACDAQEPQERGVFRALRRVYGSFYNDNAYLERLRHAVVEAQVGMAVLVHYSVPDPTEQANGVIEWSSSGFSFSHTLVVTQPGAQSVTNPEGEAQPEVVDISTFGGNAYIHKQRDASLVPLGAWVMDSPTDYEELNRLVNLVAEAYRATVPTGPLKLDLEFKKIAPGKLWLKQVRRLPQRTAASVTPFVLNRPARVCAFQGEYGDVLGIHRNKVRFTFSTRNVRLTAAERTQSLFGVSALRFPESWGQGLLEGAPSGWPDAAHDVQGDQVSDSFSVGGPARTLSITTELPQQLPLDRAPVISQPQLFLLARYAAPQPALDYQGDIGVTSEESVRLSACEDELAPDAVLLPQRRDVTGPDGLQVSTRFFWPSPPDGAVAGYTAPLAKWERTELIGLTTTPLVLTEPLAQTYRPQHHNFSEDFVFDPLADAATTAAQRTELEARDVRWLVVTGVRELTPRFYAVGFDGKLRAL